MEGTTLSRAGLGDSRRWFETAAKIDRLNHLDDCWSAYAALVGSAGPLRPEDQEALVQLVSDLAELVRDLCGEATELRSAINDLGVETIDTAFDDLLAQDPQAAGMREHLDVILQGRTFAHGVLAACEYVEASTEDEISHLRTELQSLLEGAAAEGDLRLSFKCAATLLGAGAVVVGSIGLGVMAGIPLGAAALGGLFGGSVGVGSAVMGIVAVCGDKKQRAAPA